MVNIRVIPIAILFFVITVTSSFAITLECNYRSTYGNIMENPEHSEVYNISEVNDWKITEDEYTKVESGFEIKISRNSGNILLNEIDGKRYFKGKCNKVEKSDRKF